MQTCAYQNWRVQSPIGPLVPSKAGRPRLEKAWFGIDMEFHTLSTFFFNHAIDRATQR